MATRQDIARVWKQLEAAVEREFPGAIRNLRPGCRDEAIEALGTRTALRIPAALQASLLLHDGERNPDRINLLPDGLSLLPAKKMETTWALNQKLARQFTPDEEWEWAKSIRDKIINVGGPVKPLNVSNLWLPIADRNGDEQLYLDFDPPKGGRKAQVIRVYPECCEWEVIAPDYLSFLRAHLRRLKSDYYDKDELGFNSPPRRARPKIPAYLRNVRPPKSQVARKNAADEEVRGEIVDITGIHPDCFWICIKPDGKRRQILPVGKGITRGFPKIRMGDCATIFVRDHVGEFDRKYPSAIGDEKIRKYVVEYRRN